MQQTPILKALAPSPSLLSNNMGSYKCICMYLCEIIDLQIIAHTMCTRRQYTLMNSSSE